MSFRSPGKGGLLLVPVKDASRTFSFAYLEPCATGEYAGGGFAGSGMTTECVTMTLGTAMSTSLCE